jgi:hypothetical protein
MIKLIRLAMVVVVLALTVQATPSASYAPSSGQRYFPETGHTVRGDFLIAYENAVDPVKVYGYPITEVYHNQTTGRLVQYFQKAHFELYPENPPELRIQRTLLGEILYKPGKLIHSSLDIPACKSFPETGFSVCYAFLDFFNSYGGITQFGYPISDVEIHHGRMVQYFQAARFEWHPELPSGHRVVLTDLGRLYFEMRNEDPSILTYYPDSLVPQTILQLQVRAYPLQSVTPRQGNQTLFVIVQDQNLMPVPRAQVVVTILYPSEQEKRFIMPVTDENGITSLPFSINESEYGLAKVNVSVHYNKLQQQTTTSYRIWY